ncbi:MAG: hypothetical protein ACXVCV_20500 [Polyangia bacterium]
MRVVLVVIAITAVAAVVWWRHEAAAVRAPAAAAPAIAPAAPVVSAAPPSPAHVAPPLVAAPRQPVLPPEPTLPPSTLAPPETAEALDRIKGVLLAAARDCRAPAGADPKLALRIRVATSGDHVQSLAHQEGALPPAVADCVDDRLRAARLPDGAPLTLELDIRVGDLR